MRLLEDRIERHHDANSELVEVCGDDYCDVYGLRLPGRSHTIKMTIVSKGELAKVIDDKLKILTAVKKVWGERVTTVFPKQGHYAFDPNILAEYPPPDIELAKIGDLLTYDLSAFLKKS